MKVRGLRLYHYQQLYHSQYSSQSLPDSAVSGGNGGGKKEIKRMLSLLKISSFSSDFLTSLQYSWDEAIYQVLSWLVHSVSQDQIPVLTGLHFSPVGPDSSLNGTPFQSRRTRFQSYGTPFQSCTTRFQSYGTPFQSSRTRFQS